MILPLLLLAADAPAAKPGPVEKLREVVVEAIRNCPKGKEGEIVVCSRDRGVAEGFRLPRLDPRFAQGPRAEGRDALVDPHVAATGTGSCTAVGGGGAIGCARRDYDSWGKWKRGETAKGRDVP